ncbi:hypothetical protein CPter91_0992 [Collimonas pratensis]|uniref:Uncharacterized protein n=1 Tax=Collimonas pratensis TaxID=279113 RepID=A0A127PZW8_9BURK|nr:hypothetical protein CPter91_0992 [Collimonas pratensis]
MIFKDFFYFSTILMTPGMSRFTRFSGWHALCAKKVSIAVI